MEEFLVVFLGLAGGGAGYLIVAFWMNPILRYLQIRHEVTADLVFYANVIGTDLLNDELKARGAERRVANRRHAAEIAACYHRLPWWYKRILEKREEKPLIASKRLIGLSNSFDSDGADIHLEWLKKALHLDKHLDV